MYFILGYCFGPLGSVLRLKSFPDLMATLARASTCNTVDDGNPARPALYTKTLGNMVE